LSIQSLLSEAGELTIPMSGHMDAETVAAIKNFQREHGLTPDGVVGPVTQRALKAAAAKHLNDLAHSGPVTSGTPPTGCAATPQFAQYSDVIARVDCPGKMGDNWVDVYIYDQVWLDTNHYQRVALRDLLEKAFQRNAG
jgi:hypothetical protein